MNRYELTIVFIVTVETDSREEAENIGWDWNPTHPEDSNLEEKIYPDGVTLEYMK